MMLCQEHLMDPFAFIMRCMKYQLTTIVIQACQNVTTKIVVVLQLSLSSPLLTTWIRLRDGWKTSRRMVL